MNRVEVQETLLRIKSTLTIILVLLKHFLLVILNPHHNHKQMTQYPNQDAQYTICIPWQQ